MAGDLAIVITARTSYTKLKPVIQALLNIGVRPDLYCCASMLLERYGHAVSQVATDFPTLVRIPVYSVIEGGHPISSVLSTAALTQALGQVFASTQPKLVVIMADRHETLGASIAAAYQNIPIAHLQGGEQSGNIDDRVRNANTALATYHFPATQAAKSRLWFTGVPDSVFMYGCPSIDLARQAVNDLRVSNTELGGDGPLLDLDGPFATVLYHPEPYASGYIVMHDILTRLERLHIPQLVFWPGQDAGMEGISKAIRETKAERPLRTVRTLPPEHFLRLLYQTTMLVGNSSAGIRECAFIGTPVFNIGERQANRERAGNVTDGLPTFVTPHLKYPSSALYGDGYAAPRIAAKLKDLLCP